MISVLVQLIAEVDEAHAELCALALHEAGADAVELRDATLVLPEGVTAPADGRVELRTYFTSADDALEAREALSSLSAAAAVQLLPVVEKDWAQKWRDDFLSVQVGRVWVGPWEPEEGEGGTAESSASIRVVIPPGVAFGNGDHPSTTACLEFLERWVPAHPGVSMLDVGTGTGVLAIVARKLGAGRVVGVDIAAEVVAWAAANAERNGVAEVELSTRPVGEVEGRFDLVLANILDPVLLALAPDICARVGSRLVLAGIRASEREKVEQAYAAQGLRCVAGKESTRPNHANRWVILEWERAS